VRRAAAGGSSASFLRRGLAHPVKIWVSVKPQAKRAEVKKIAEGEYAASVQAPAREGKANQALIELLASYFAVPKSSVKIVRGESSRRKLVEIA
jgi:uncharacterized protein